MGGELIEFLEGSNAGLFFVHWFGFSTPPPDLQGCRRLTPKDLRSEYRLIQIIDAVTPSVVRMRVFRAGGGKREAALLDAFGGHELVSDLLHRQRFTA